MRGLAHGAAVLGLGLLASAAAAQPAIGVGGGDCGSPNLSKSVGKAFVMRADRPCLSFHNDVGRLAELTLGTSVGFPRLRVMPQSELKSIELSRDGHRVRVFGGVVSAGEIAIRIEPLEGPVTVTLQGFRRASTAPHARGRPAPALPRARAAAPAGQDGGDVNARLSSE